MKICVTSQGPELSSAVDPRFGRARYFIVYDDESDSFEAIDNEENVKAAGGAGLQAGASVAQTGCEWVISGHIGPRAMSVLQTANVKVAVGASGTVREALSDFREGRLQQADGADVPPHW